MTLDNSKTVIAFRIRLFFVTLVALAWVAVAYIIKLLKFPLLGIEDWIFTLVIVAAWLIVAFWPMIFNHQFVWFSDDGDNITFRYFNAGIVGGKKNSVQISKRNFYGYKLESGFLGLSRSILLYQKVGGNVAKYPPIHISALTKNQTAQVMHVLDSYSAERNITAQ